MTMYDIIMKKRRGMELSDEEIAFFISGYVSGSIPDYQASALCMAICFQGMSDREIATLTDVMAKSGDMMDLSAFGNLSVDKHSTGGVGDKTSLIVCPIVASLGGKVAKMSGRGLGHILVLPLSQICSSITVSPHAQTFWCCAPLSLCQEPKVCPSSVGISSVFVIPQSSQV